MKISVICVTYNRPAMLIRAVKSFLKQETSCEKELFIVLNGCTESYDNAISHIIELDKNNEISHVIIKNNTLESFNWAINQVNGDAVTFLHDDDEFYSNESLATRCGKILDYNADMTWTDGEYGGNKSGYIMGGDPSRERILSEDYILFPSLAFTRNAWNICGGMDMALRFNCDWLLKIRALNRVICLWIPLPTLIYHCHDGQETHKISREQRQIEYEYMRKELAKDGIKF